MSNIRDNLNFLEQLLTTPSPTGFEISGQKVWLSHLSPVADRVIKDPYGSAAVVLDVNPQAPTIMLEAHCDEIGFIVRHVSDDGFIYVTRLGGSDPTIARAKRVHIHNKKGVVSGVFGNTAIHLQDRENYKKPDWKDLYLDVGATNREEALQLISIGDPVTYADDIEYLNDQLITARALDNRIGGFIIAQAFKLLADQRSKLRFNLAAVNSVQEEIGGFGARMMTELVKPSLAFVTDVTHSTDTPGINHKEHGKIELGKGPSFTRGAANQNKVVDYLEQIAKDSSIPYQLESTSTRTGTDTDSIYHQRGGIPSALISLPLRYMHSPVETAHFDDIENLVSVMTQAVLKLDELDRFDPWY